MNEALSSTKCQKNRDSRPWSPSLTIVTLAMRVSGESSSLKADTIALTREAKSFPLVCNWTCDMSTPSKEFVPNKELRIAGSEDLPTHKNMSSPLSNKKMPLLASLSMVRSSTLGSSMRFFPATFSDVVLPADGRPALELMLCSENMRGYTKCFDAVTSMLLSRCMACTRSSG